MSLTLSTVSKINRRALWAATFVAASVLFSFAWACALPLAGFAAVAALTSTRRAALLLTGAVWLTNQAMGFLFLHYPTDPTTLFWGGALGVIALLSCESAGLLARRFPGLRGGLAAFLSSFVAYESLISGRHRGDGTRRRPFHRADRLQIFFVNLGAFAGLLILKAAGAAVANRDLSETFASRPT